MADETAARRAAQDQWGRNPADTTYTSAEPGTPEFFAEMSRIRYELQPWHPDLLRRFAPQGPLLEIGCGAGTDHAELAAIAGDSVAVDLAHTGASLTQRRLRLEGRSGSAIVADGERLPFSDATFSSVYSFGVIHHTDHPETVIEEIRRVLRPGGRFLVAIYHRYSLFTATVVYRWLRQWPRRRQPWSEFLAGIEAGAADLDEKPRVVLTSRRRARHLFAAFDDVTLETDHLGVELASMQKIVGPSRVEGLARWFGWYVIVTGTRPAR